MSTAMTVPLLSVAVQVMVCADELTYDSPPLGESTVTVGGVVSGPTVGVR